MKYSSSVGLALTGGLTLAAASSKKIVQLDLKGTHPSIAYRRGLGARDTIDAPLENNLFNYNLNLTIGTPPQNFSLYVDTGSSDVWVNSALSEYCQGKDKPCVGGFYDASESSTFVDSLPGLFNISYADGSEAIGDYFEDTVTIQGIKIINQTVGLANVSVDNPRGLIGIGYQINEALCAAGDHSCYPSIVSQMASQGHINSRAFSLWLNDLNASTGSLLFGGVDSSKYTGDLTVLPLVPDLVLSQQDQYVYREYQVEWAGLTLSTTNGSLSAGWPEGYATNVVLDSGTAFNRWPPAVVETLYELMGAENVEGSWYAPCSLRTSNTTLDFALGGTEGAIIKVPLREFLVDQPDSTYKGGETACAVGFSAAQEGQTIFGDTTLRSMYVVYDQENNQVAVANTNFDAGDAAIQELGVNNATDIPGASVTVSSINLSAIVAANTDFTPGAEPTTLSSFGNAPTPSLAAFTTASYTGQGAIPSETGSSSSSGSGSGSGNSGVRPIPSSFLAMGGLTVASVFAGMILL